MKAVVSWPLRPKTSKAKLWLLLPAVTGGRLSGDHESIVALSSQLAVSGLEPPRAEMSVGDLTKAAGLGDLVTLEHLHSSRQAQEWPASISSEAAAMGQLDTLKWLRAHSCPWDSDTFQQALDNRSAFDRAMSLRPKDGIEMGGLLL